MAIPTVPGLSAAQPRVNVLLFGEFDLTAHVKILIE
jgi:hypothetical protein